MYVQDEVLFDHLVRALCRNNVDIILLLAEIIEQTEGNLTRFTRDRLMQLYIEVSNYEIIKRIFKHLGFSGSHSGDMLVGNITSLAISAAFDPSQLTILINCSFQCL